MEDEIGDKHWIWKNEQIKKLPKMCRDELLEMAKKDVKICIDNNGIHDLICQSMAFDVKWMEEYFNEGE